MLREGHLLLCLSASKLSLHRGVNPTGNGVLIMEMSMETIGLGP